MEQGWSGSPETALSLRRDPEQEGRELILRFILTVDSVATLKKHLAN